MYLYEAIATPSGDGRYDIRFPDLDIMTFGNDLYDAAYMAQDLLSLHLSTLLKKNEELPTPTMDHDVPEDGYAIGIAVDCSKDAPEIEFMSVQEAADILDVSTPRIYAMLRNGILAGKKVGGAQLVSTQSVKDRFNNPRPAGRPKKAALETLGAAELKAAPQGS